MAGLGWAYIFGNLAISTNSGVWFFMAIEALTVFAIVAFAYIVKQSKLLQNEAVTKVDGLLGT